MKIGDVIRCIDSKGDPAIESFFKEGELYEVNTFLVIPDTPDLVGVLTGGRVFYMKADRFVVVEQEEGNDTGIGVQ